MSNDDPVEFVRHRSIITCSSVLSVIFFSPFQQPGLSEWNENETHASSMTGGTWDDQDDFNGLSQEASEALRGTEKNSDIDFLPNN